MNRNRVIQNTLASYGRGLANAFVGLFSARWLLEALGSSDLGLYGVVCGIVFVFSFLTPVLSISIGRFYAYSVDSPEKLRSWFNAAFGLMALLSGLLLLAAYPLGLFALHHWLTVPVGRLGAATWAFRFALGAAFVSMLSVPFVALFSAKQDIVEAASFQLLQTLLVFSGVAVLRFSSLAKGQFDGLVLYAAAAAFAVIGCSLMQVVRVRRKYAECSFKWGTLFQPSRIKPLLQFTGWQTLGGVAWMIRSQGLTFFLNLAFGPSYNAGFSIANQVSNQAASLSASLGGALGPVITRAEGCGRRREMLQIAKKASLLSGGLVLAFAIPLVAFVHPILKLWLKNPPPGCAQLCVAMLLVAVIRQFASGQGGAILAEGKIGRWQVCDAVISVLTVPVAYALWRMGLGIAAVGWGCVIAETGASLNRWFFASRLRTSTGNNS